MKLPTPDAIGHFAYSQLVKRRPKPGHHVALSRPCTLEDLAFNTCACCGWVSPKPIELDLNFRG